MRMSHRLCAGVLAVLLLGSPSAFADAGPGATEELRSLRRSVEALQKTLEAQQWLIEQQQAQLDALQRQAAAPPAPAPRQGPTPSSGIGQIGAILPEIGVLTDIVATASENKADTEGNNRVAVREVELVLGNYVDPYSRYDATIAFSDFEAVSLEEAYLTRWGLPWEWKARFGRFAPRVGKAPSIHRDSLDSVDEPLVVARYFGVEGYKRAGLDLTRPFEGPWGTVLEPSVGILEGGVGEDGTLFGSTRLRPTVYSHLKTFKELSDASSVELGLTHLAGSKDDDATWEVNAFGVDATYLNALTPTTKLKLQSELYVQNREEAFDRHPWGAYVLTDYRFAPRWSVGARADHVRLVDTITARHADQALSAWLTFYQSEFARWRLQYRHMERASEKTEDAVFLQGTFALGTHKHAIQ